MISHKKSNKVISRIKRPDNNITTNQLEIPNILNKHFGSVVPQLASKIPHSPIHFSQYLPKDSSPSSSFAFNLVLPGEVEADIKSLPPNKVLGLYSCPVRILKDASQTLSKPLAILLNKSVPCISRTFFLKVEGKNQGCGLSMDTSVFGILKNLIDIHKIS